MLKKILLASVVMAIPVTATAHEMWLERGQGNLVRAYVGDVNGTPDKGDDVAKLVSVTEVFTTDRTTPAVLVARDDHLEATLSGAGDVRLYTDQVWAPWKSDDGAYQAAAFQAKAGRDSTTAVFDLELVPVQANSDTFTVIFQGKALSGAAVTVITPDKWEKTFTANERGQVTVPVNEKGLFILVTRHNAATNKDIGGKTVTKLQNIASVSFTVQ